MVSVRPTVPTSTKPATDSGVQKSEYSTQVLGETYKRIR